MELINNQFLHSTSFDSHSFKFHSKTEYKVKKETRKRKGRERERERGRDNQQHPRFSILFINVLK